MANIKDVAEKAGVSVMTVSRVLNDKGYVSEEKRQRVLKCVEALQYRPNMLARSLVLNRTSTVGVVLSRIANPVYSEYVDSLSETFRRHGIDVILSTVDNTQAWASGIRTLLGKQVDGLVILPTEFCEHADGLPEQELAKRNESLWDATVRQLSAEGKPIVLISDMLLRKKDARVKHDYYAGARLATQKLIEMGHRRIGNLRFALGDETGGFWYDRARGFDDVMAEHGLKVREEWIITCCDDDISLARKAVLSWLDRMDELPTALVCSNDDFAIGALQALNERGLRAPKDISLIGHDGSPYCKCTAPCLTTVSIQPREAGKKAAELLLRMLRTPEKVKEDETILIPPKFQAGGTVRTLNEAASENLKRIASL